MGIEIDFESFRAWMIPIASGEMAQSVTQETLDNMLSATIANVPIGDGNMLNVMSETFGPTKTGDGWQAGIGNADKVGDPSRKAPPNLISYFLEWYRGRKRGAGK